MVDVQSKRYTDKLKELLHLKAKQNQQFENPEAGAHVAVPVGDDLYEDVIDPDAAKENAFPIRRHPEQDVIDPSLMQQPAYDDNGIQILNDIASDESLPVLNYYIAQLSQLGEKAQSRLIVRASAALSKNYVFSNIVDSRDYMMAQDDFKYAQLLSKADFTAFDMNTDMFTAEAVLEANFNARIRRSRKALNLQMINTQRTEMAGGGYQQEEQHQKIWQKVPFLGGGNRGQ
jgi:hypothetical protein